MVAAVQPAAILSVTPHLRRGIGVKLGLAKRAMGSSHAMCGNKRIQSRSRMPVLFGEDMEDGRAEEGLTETNG